MLEYFLEIFEGISCFAARSDVCVFPKMIRHSGPVYIRPVESSTGQAQYGQPNLNTDFSYHLEMCWKISSIFV